MSDQTDQPVDYKATVFLPRTDFPMRAGLPKKEPEILDWWREIGLYKRLRAASAGRKPFILHDGPPYANGNIHIGTGLNKILKDIVVRAQQMMGRDANYVPGWDCHGLPIEWKIEEQYRAQGKDKDAVPILQLRQECREFAEHWVGVQSAEFQRLGVIGDWENPYLTMARPAEAQIVREIHKFLLNGGLYKGLRPILWSVVEKTALADAEVEYQDHTSDTVHVCFPVAETPRDSLAGASLVAWTTTPWTLPGNRALAYGPEIEYGLYRVDDAGESALAKVGERLVIARDLASQVAEAGAINTLTLLESFPGSALEGVACRHPLWEQGYEDLRPVLPAGFVTTEQGAGIVHIAPGHGADDFELGRAHGLEVPETVTEDGRFMATVPLFAGLAIYDQKGRRGEANDRVMEAIASAGRLLARGKLRHSYPHSWRSKAPLIFRATAQWFISMEQNDLRNVALKALENTRFFPSSGYNRLSSMIAQRPDWCISRQRAWGVPIALFVNRETGEVLKDPEVLERIAAVFEAEGADAWFGGDPQQFLGASYRVEDWTQVFDIVDVWFESGSTHSFVLEQREDLEWPASLYLEGSDQHRGWFHSSLLESCGTRGRAPYEAVLTHGFVMDEKGRKMSKSLGNVVAPQEVIDKSGADILRLWVVSMDYSEDLRIGPEILGYQADAYRRIRNTLRYLLGALNGFSDSERGSPEAMPELERWVLHRLAELDGMVRRSSEAFEFHELFQALHAFCNEDLSAFYFDVRKDVLYCGAMDDPVRRAMRTVLDEIFARLTAWLAPVLCFTAEEAWLARNGRERGSVHERLFPETPVEWLDRGLSEKWQAVRRIRRVITGALERERVEKRIGSSLQAHPVVYLDETNARVVDGLDLAEIAIASAITVADGAGPADAFRLPEVGGVAVVTNLAEGDKCQRCWKVLPEVGRQSRPGLCQRCSDVVDRQQDAA